MDAVAQVAMAVATAWIVWRLGFSRRQRFRTDIGLVVPPWRAVGVAMALAAPFAWVTWASQVLVPGLPATLREQHLVLSPIASAKSWSDAVSTTFSYACLQTALTEEILFRGIVAKGLASRLSFARANVLQALLFALTHSVMLFVAVPQGRPIVHGLAFAVPFSFSLVGFYVNERVGLGSIGPSWVLHAAINLTAGLTFFALLALERT